jgi:hypothetical protein
MPAISANIGLAPGKSNHLYLAHWKGNEQALGLYYPDLPTQWSLVEKDYPTGFCPVCLPPIKFSTGWLGVNFIEFQSFLQNQQYWGMVSTVLDAEKRCFAFLDRHAPAAGFEHEPFLSPGKQVISVG